MAKTKTQLKELSDITFFDNTTGLITPDKHREFNNDLIDALPEFGIATTATAGLVKSSGANLKVKVATDGTMDVVGLKDALDKIPEEIGGTTIETIEITNFDTFNPNEHPVTSKLKAGEFCNFTSPQGARGGYVCESFFGSPAIFPMAGTITRIVSDDNIFTLTAVTPLASTFFPGLLTKTYGDTGGDWIASSDIADFSSSAAGYTQLPSGITIQWGMRAARANTTGTISFSKSFSTIPFSVVISSGSDNSGRLVNMVADVATMTNSQFNYNCYPKTGVGTEMYTYFWVAIGLR